MSDEPLDQVNRAVISIVALLVVFATLLLVLLAWAEPGATINRIEDLAGWLRDHNDDEGKLIFTLLSVIVILLMLGLIVIQLTPSPTQRMRLRQVKSGDATLTTVAIAERVEQELRAVRGVAEAQAIVAARGNKVELVLDLEVQPAANLAATADEACSRAQGLVEQGMGVALVAPPRARLHYRELQLRPSSATSSAPMAPAQPATGWERPHGTDDGGN